ncbi:hypothetical protein HYW21_06040 [Candidatus Woesearchaeota archaeon]|nr:hypothetical protein [Candidatus Woesearchaeota archaeon]
MIEHHLYQGPGHDPHSHRAEYRPRREIHHPWRHLQRGTVLRDVELLDGPHPTRDKGPFVVWDDVYIHVREPSDSLAKQFYSGLRKGSYVTLGLIDDGNQKESGLHYQAVLVVPNAPSEQSLRLSPQPSRYFTLDHEIQERHISVSPNGEDQVYRCPSLEERAELEQRWGRPIQEPNAERLQRAFAPLK